ncbi:hypothetical protein WME90_29975 [Sorangium sp. So ce375]|uniref:hypothetical protein n=1 Tax=Sorangium sp. So ce375 TaxID=3133306 RepID=UPI003F5B043D
MPPDYKAIAAKANGLAPASLIAKARPGAVFIVDDKLVVLPDSRKPGVKRTWHDGRRVIIVQSQQMSRAGIPSTILAVPCSASAKLAGPWDMLLPNGEEGFDCTGVIAYASLVQPFLKSDLERYVGQLQDDTLIELQRLVLMNLGLVQTDQVQLPARDGISKPEDDAAPAAQAPTG